MPRMPKRILIVDYPGESRLPSGDGTPLSRLLSSHGMEPLRYIPTPGRGRLHRLRDFFGIGAEVAEFRRVLGAVHPDVVHVVGNAGGLAPSLAATARACGLRTVWSLRDYRVVCGSGNCRQPGGDVCEDCLHGRRRVMLRRCVGGSSLDSFVALLGMLYWDVRRLTECADVFVTPSAFMRSKLMEAGFASSKVTALHDPLEDAGEVADEREDYFCFTGDLTSESGVETAARAAVQAGVRLVIAGEGALLERLKQLSDREPTLTVIPDAGEEVSAKVIRRSKGAVIAGEGYLEGVRQLKRALCAGTPVIASAIADLPEMVSDGDGITFTPGNWEELSAVLRDFDKRHAFIPGDIARRAREKYSESEYYKNLTRIYGNAE